MSLSRRITAMSSLLLAALLPLVSSHTIISYPGIRGDNLNQNGTIEESHGLVSGPNNSYPYGMQWAYPCGGMPISQNRTKWPVTGGAVGIQPGWFNGHSTALIYINLGEGTIPLNYSLIMQPMFGITGPNNSFYNGSICMPQVALPVNFTAKVGDNATIQVIEAAQHGAALYNCVDITFADPNDPELEEVTPDNCGNSSWINVDYVYNTASLTSDASMTALTQRTRWAALLPMVAAAMWFMA